MIDGRNMKERILRLLSDGKPHSALEIALSAGGGGPAWSWDQRKNELVRDHGFHIEKLQTDKANRYAYRLLDPPELIDFDNLRLKEPACLQESLPIGIERGEG